MATHIGIGFSQEQNTLHAAREAALQAKAQIKQQTIDLAIVFTTTHYSPLETLKTVSQTLNQAKILGCSTAGIVLAQGIYLRGVAVAVISSQEIQFGIGYTDNLTDSNAQAAGTELGKTMIGNLGSHQRQALLFFSDGLLQNNSDMVKGIQQIFGNVFPLIGAGSSDNFEFKETFQYFKDKSLKRSAVSVLIGGQIRIGLGSHHGWKPLGKPRLANKTNHNVLKLIDNKKASSIYEEYLKLSLKELQSDVKKTVLRYPLGIYLEHEKEYLLRPVVEIADDGSLTCQGEIPENSEVHIMISNKEFCRQATREAIRQVQNALLGKNPQMIMIFESFLRQKILGRDAFKEIEFIKDRLGSMTAIIGMYSYGETAPLGSLNHSGNTYLQHGTITILGIG